MTSLGVFDSGVGGLSVLRDVQSQMPALPCVYVADNAFAPYGEREVETILQRAQQITDYLRKHWQIDALIIACNTATAHAIDALRKSHPDLPIIGVEPALKPAAGLTASGQVGVLATRRTLSSNRFNRLQRQVESHGNRPVHFWLQACDGLADAIERHRPEEVEALCQRYVSNLLGAGPEAAHIDTVVLGCTHYPFALDALQAAVQGHAVRFIDTGLPVAKRARDVLAPLMNVGSSDSPALLPTLLSTGDAADLSYAARRWINPLLQAHAIAI